MAPPRAQPITTNGQRFWRKQKHQIFGEDRAALDVTIELDIPHGGWIPKGRKTEDGVLPDKIALNL
ncbi:MAG: putative molybdenum carrier protein [Proteobacteria bacterium]|nr:putative molybdenum carrier protein [Pseudomonadota bacterium]